MVIFEIAVIFLKISQAVKCLFCKWDDSLIGNVFRMYVYFSLKERYKCEDVILLFIGYYEVFLLVRPL